MEITDAVLSFTYSCRKCEGWVKPTTFPNKNNLIYRNCRNQRLAWTNKSLQILREQVTTYAKLLLKIRRDAGLGELN